MFLGFLHSSGSGADGYMDENLTKLSIELLIHDRVIISNVKPFLPASSLSSEECCAMGE